MRLNETRRELLVEVPIPDETNEQLNDCNRTLAQIEEIAKMHSKGR